MPRLLLINPSHGHKHLGSTSATTWPPLHLPYLAAVTPRHYQIEVIDENIEPFQPRKADIVGVTAYTPSVYRAYQLAQVYRKKSIPTIMGGIHVSMMPDEAMRYCDSVVVGEAENIWPKVLEDFEAGKLQKQYTGTWADMESLPIPRRDILQNPYYRWGSIQTSRGCPMNCSFCSVTAFNGRRFRRRNLDSVIEELEQIPQKWISMNDDNIIGYGKKDMEWIYSFFSRILEKGIKKNFFAQASILFGENRKLIRLAARAGLKVVFSGIESINPKTLQSYRKIINLENLQQGRYKELISNIRKEGIVFFGGFVIGSDDDDRSVFYPTLKFIQSSRIDILQTSKLTPLPGTPLWNSLQKEGRILTHNFPKDWEEYRFSRLVFKPVKISIEDAYEGFVYLRKRYYSFWETLKRTFYTLIATKSINSTFMAFKFNYAYWKPYRNSEHYRLYNKPGLEKKFEI
jgi:radical SAM superfamily enzyme YgiQ (UPF0313 family)